MTAADKITDFAIQKLDALFAATEKVLPTVTKYTTEVTSMGCMINVVYWFIVVICFSISSFVCFKSWVYVCDHDKDEYCDRLFTPFIVSAIVTTLSSIILLIAVFASLDIWQFVCINHPDLYLIHLAVEKITR